MQYLLAALVLAPFSGFLWAYFLRQKKTPRIVRETVPALSLRLSHSGGIIEDHSFPAGRISCGFSPDYDIDLTKYAKPGRITSKSPAEELAFQLADGRLAVTAHSKVMMNGVERTSGSIPVGGSLLFKTCRFTFLGQVELQKERRVYLGKSTLGKLATVPSAASLAAVALLVLGLVDLGTSGYLKMPAPKPSVVMEQQEPAVTSTVAVPEPAPAITPATAPIPEPAKRPVVVPLRSAVRPEPIKPVPERRSAPATAPVPEPAKRPVVVPLRSAVRPEPIKPLPERRSAPPPAPPPAPSPAPVTAPATVPVPEPAKRPVVVPLRSAVRPEPIKPLPERRPAPKVEARPKPETEPKPVAMARPVPAPETQPLPLPYPAPLMVKPGEPIPDERVDVLFIHAHPDDESLDYGALMALCSKAGLRTATVLLTDGEGGIYQQDYTGPRDNMVSTRIQEATRALQFLGSAIYLRLGLRNSPYNSLLEEKGVQEVLMLWGGDAVAARLAGIIDTLRPKVVISPEGPSFAREHFEHETTGVLTLMALQQLRLTGRHVPEAHLVAIDPRQKEAYTGLIAFPRQRVLERQRLALLSHATQADATYFGVQIIEKYSEEYYLIQYWDIAIHFSQFFGLVSARPGPTPSPDAPSMASTESFRQAP